MKFFQRAAGPMAALGSITVSPNFQIDSQDARLEGQTRATANTNAPALPPVFTMLQGTFAGTGLNTIFRPNSLGKTGGTTFPNGVNSTNVLALHLMSETLAFSPNIGNIPNRGMDPQPDIFISAIPYTQAINDVTNIQTGKADAPITSTSGIHFEPGMFLAIPPISQSPAVGATINRVASIPHGVTVNVQALEPVSSVPAPQFPPIDMTPFSLTDGHKIRFPSQTANNTGAARIPQDITKFIQAGTFTQAILDNPSIVLQQASAGQKFDKVFVFTLASTPAAPITGGGIANDAFLTGGAKPNAFVPDMNATFWIETVNWTVTVPPSKAGQNQILTPVKPNNNVTLPTFSVTPPKDVTKAINITAQSTQIQYSQQINLNFNGLGWPHFSLNTLTQQGNIPVPASAFN